MSKENRINPMTEMPMANRISPTKVLVLRFWPNELQKKSCFEFEVEVKTRFCLEWIKNEEWRTWDSAAPTKSSRRISLRSLDVQLDAPEEHRGLSQSRRMWRLACPAPEGGKQSSETECHYDCLHSTNHPHYNLCFCCMLLSNRCPYVRLQTDTRRPLEPAETQSFS